MSSKMYWLRTPADSLGRINQRLVAAATTVSAATVGVTAIAPSDVKHTRYENVRVCCVATARRVSPFVHEIAKAKTRMVGKLK